MTEILKVADRTFYVLEYILENHDAEYTLTDISKNLKLNKTVVFRILRTLIHRGYIVKDPKTETFSPGFKLIELGARAQEKIPLHRLARPYLEELSQKTGETTNLGVLSGRDVVYLDKIESSNFLRADLRVGTKVPLYCSALGKAILAFSRNQEIIETFDFKVYTHSTIRTKSQLQQELDSIRIRGYSLDDEEYILGIRCIAAPILNRLGFASAALSVSGPKIRLSDNRIADLCDYLKDATSRLAKEVYGKEGINNEDL